MIINNEKGMTLVENVVAVFVLLVLTSMIVAAYLTGLNAYKKQVIEYNRVNTLYEVNETIDNATLTSDQQSEGLEKKSGSIQFSYDGGTIEVEGSYIYDKDQQKIGEFVMED